MDDLYIMFKGLEDMKHPFVEVYVGYDKAVAAARETLEEMPFYDIDIFEAEVDENGLIVHTGAPIEDWRKEAGMKKLENTYILTIMDTTYDPGWIYDTVIIGKENAMNAFEFEQGDNLTVDLYEAWINTQGYVCRNFKVDDKPLKHWSYDEEVKGDDAIQDI